MRPVLVLLNGLPASGKSTLARAWCARAGSDLALALDVDVLRGMLGGWRERRIDAGFAARAMALAAAGAHLRAGRDVVVPQYVARARFVDELAATAKELGAAFLECVLVTDPAVATDRFAARAVDSVARGRDDEGALDEPMPVTVAGFQAFVAGRPDAVRIDPLLGDGVDQLAAAIEAARTS